MKHQIHCLLVLDLQLFGDGSFSAEIILSFLNHPCIKAMKLSNFHHIESKLAPKVCQMGEKSIESVMKEEVYLQMKQEG